MTMHPRVLSGRGCDPRGCRPDALGGQSARHVTGALGAAHGRAEPLRGSAGKGNQVPRQPSNGRRVERAPKGPGGRQAME